MTSLERVESVVKAVLYEGYMLYPYRPSSVKNRQRWTFGGVYPKACAKEDPSLRPAMQTECLLNGGEDTRLNIRVRFLHLLMREVGRLETPLAEFPHDREPAFATVASLDVGEKRIHAWEEAVERTVTAEGLALNEMLASQVLVPFRFPGQRTVEPVRGADRMIPGVLVRTAVPVQGDLILSARNIASGVFKLTVTIINTTPVEEPAELVRSGAQRYAFASTHTILSVENGAFISLLDPPDALAEAARACDNQGTWPVMAGERGETDVMLSSPIILYDYPEVAPESPGDLFDATEIDEILTLRILTMTDDEKRDMAAVDERARALLERTEALTAADMARMHGTVRDLKPSVVAPGEGLSSPSPRLRGEGRSEGQGQAAAPASAPRPNPLPVSTGRGDLSREPPADSSSASDALRALDKKPQLAFLRIHGTDLKVGDRVRLHPRVGADIMDMVLKDEVAVIEAIERDFEDRVHVAVVLENDPGRELGFDRMPGHRFFFSPDEIEALPEEAGP